MTAEYTGHPASSTIGFHFHSAPGTSCKQSTGGALHLQLPQVQPCPHEHPWLYCPSVELGHVPPTSVMSMTLSLLDTIPEILKSKHIVIEWCVDLRTCSCVRWAVALGLRLCAGKAPCASLISVTAPGTLVVLAPGPGTPGAPCYSCK